MENKYKIIATYNKNKPKNKFKNVKWVKTDLTKFNECIKVTKNIDIVLVNNQTEDNINNIMSTYQNHNVKFIKGDFTLDSTLNNANASEAKHAVILNDEKFINDEKIILATLSLKKVSPKIKVVAQLNDQEKISFLKRANVDVVLTNHSFESFMTTFHITNPSVAHAIENIIDKNSDNNVKNRTIPEEYVGKKFSELFNYFYNEKNEICIGTFYEEENMGISEFLSSDTSALDKFIENKLKEHGHSLDDKNKLNVNLNPNKDDIINCYIDNINKLGIVAYIKLSELIKSTDININIDNEIDTFSNSPLIIIIPETNIDDITKYNKNDNINIKVVAIRIKYNSDKIQLIGSMI